MTSASDGMELDRTASHTWGLFVDWCHATGHIALPARPEALAEFLSDHPAALGTHRRRVTAINSAHRQQGFPEPGHAQAVRAALASWRQARLQAIADDLDERIQQLPVSGWPQGMFGRRDALILTLVAAGLTYAEIAALRRGELRRVGHELVIASNRALRLGSSPEVGDRNPPAVYDRWARVQEILDRYPTIRTLAHYFEHPLALEADRPAPVLDPRASDQPLIVSIDRWGYTPLRPPPLTAQSIAAITHSHVSGQASTHRHGLSLPSAIAELGAPQTPEGTEKQVALDTRYYARGVTARRRASVWLSDVGDELDDIADRAEQLLEQLAAVVDGAFQTPAADGD